MLADSNDAAHIQDMIEAGQKAMEFAKNKSRGDLDIDAMLRAALERQVEIFGEAARRTSTSLQGAHPEVPWLKIIGTRHIIGHDYDTINPDIIWLIVSEHIPETLPLLRKMIPPPPPLSELEPDYKEPT